MSDIFKKLSEPFPLKAVSWRAQTITKDGTKALALAYVDARDVMERLDSAVGPENWQNKYSHANGKTVCDIGIKIGAEWVWKADGAGDSDIEAEKGALSDAFKRAAVRWGVGRYLYDFGNTYVPCETYEFNGKRKWSKWTEDPWKHVNSETRKIATPSAPSTDDLKKNSAAICEGIDGAKNEADLSGVLEKYKSDIEILPATWKKALDSRIAKRKVELAQTNGAAA